MPDTTQLHEHLTGSERRTPDEHRARVDELLHKIEDEELIPNAAWAVMTETVAQLTALADDLAWIAPAYLSHVIVRGHAMFTHAAAQSALLDDTQGRAKRPCDACGADVVVPPPVQYRPRMAQVVDCDACGREAVLFDGDAYDAPTLITQSPYV